MAAHVGKDNTLTEYATGVIRSNNAGWLTDLYKTYVPITKSLTGLASTKKCV